MIDYELIRSKRRTLSILVDQEGALQVRAPLKMPLREIEAFLEAKKGWIEQKRRMAQQRETFTLRNGAQMPYLGGWLTVRLADCPRPDRRQETLFLPLEGDWNASAKQWRMQEARRILAPRVDMWRKATGICMGKLSFGNAKKRWGSMNAKGDMRLNAALLHCPIKLCDYVIVHELCHIAHPDHSQAFHAAVRAILPDERLRREEIKKLGYLTTLL